MSKVTEMFRGAGCASADTLLELCKGVYEEVLVVGYTKEGILTARPTQGIASSGRINLMLDTIKLSLLLGSYETEQRPQETH